MTIHVSIAEASMHLPELIEKACNGEEVFIDLGEGEGERVGLIVSKRQPQKALKQQRTPGIDEGRLIIPEDFNDPLPAEILQAFEGE